MRARSWISIAIFAVVAGAGAVHARTPRVRVLATGGTIAGAQASSVDKLEQLPRVDILYAHANMSPDLIESAVKAGAQGLVIAGVGDGNMTGPALEAITKAAKNGIVVVRSTRLPMGQVLRNNEVDDDKLGLVASGELNPPHARVLLQLALTRTKDPTAIQRMFYTY